MELLEQKRNELNFFIDNLCLSSEAVVKKAREFEDLANKTYNIKDGAYWMQKAKSLEVLLNQVQIYCPENYKTEIEKVLMV